MLPQWKLLIGWACLLAFVWVPASYALTVAPDQAGIEFIAPGSMWRYLPGREAPPTAWSQLGFDDTAWQTGQAGFGYGDGDDTTELDDMRGSYLTVYLRQSFVAAQLPPDTMLELSIDYDDGFVAYLNGREVARRSITSGPVDFQTKGKSHEAGKPETIRLGTAEELLVNGENLLAVEGHNISLTSSDFSLHPALKTANPLRRTGSTWIVESPVLSISGKVETEEAATVTVTQGEAIFVSESGTWNADVTLLPGLNSLIATTLGSEGQDLEEALLEVVYIPPENYVSAPLDPNTLWTDAVMVDKDLTVGPNAVLTITPGTWVLLDDNVRLEIQGRLIADGNETAPIRFTHTGEGRAWKQIRFEGTDTSRLSHCIFEYADCDGAHQDYYEPGPRDYHEALVVLTGHVDIAYCTFQKLPVEGKQSDGDAIAVISDDPNIAGPATASVRHCRFLGIGQGVHTRYSHVLVEHCFFTDKHGDNDDVDLYGESDPPPLIRYNHFLNPDHDDMINPTRCSAIIEGNIIQGSDDHGIVLRDTCFPIVTNNLIVDCANGGIAVENTCDALLINNTIVDCGRAVRVFDLGRWGPPYRLAPGGGRATLINCIIWDCKATITLTDSSNKDIKDRGSYVTVIHSNIEGGQENIAISGSQSSLTWGEGNIEADPVFVNPEKINYRLAAASPCIDTGQTGDAPPLDLDGLPRPWGPEVDMGAYEYREDPPE